MDEQDTQMEAKKEEKLNFYKEAFINKFVDLGVVVRNGDKVDFVSDDCKTVLEASLHASRHEIRHLLKLVEDKDYIPNTLPT